MLKPLALAVCLLLSTAAPSLACTTVDQLRDSQLERILTRSGFKFREKAANPHSTYYVNINNEHAVFYIKGNDLRFMTWVPDRGRVSMRAVNTWNHRQKGKTYIDKKDKFVVFKHILELDGGVCPERVYDFVKQTKALSRLWITDVLKQRVPSNFPGNDPFKSDPFQNSSEDPFG